MYPVWRAELLAVSFADIELLDRDSGFIRIDFSGNADTYANCGRIENAPNPWGFTGWGTPKWSRRYATWLEENGGFRGRINIRAHETDSEPLSMHVEPITSYFGRRSIDEKSILRILVAVCGNRIHGAYIFPVPFELP